MTDERDPYAVLGIPSSASDEDVTTAYRAQARRHHPDVSRAADAERRMAEINAAWTVLRDPARRAAWDRAHGVTPGAARGSTAAHPRPPSGAAPGWRPPAPAPAAPRQGGPQWRRGPHGEGAAGPPPGAPRGSILPFGRHIGWSLGEVARVDPGYLVWLQARREGAPYREEIARLLEAIRPRAAEPDDAPTRRSRMFRRG